MKNIQKQIRTCISCRNKDFQKNLLRLQCIDKSLVLFSKNNRSFYLCEICVTNSKNVTKSLYRQCKNKADYQKQLQEIVQIWKTK